MSAEEGSTAEIQAVREAHRRMSAEDVVDWCSECEMDWPCDTALVLAALDEAEAKQCQMAEGARRLIAAARSAMKLPRPWIDGNVTFEEWDAAFQALDEALRASEEGA